MDIQTTLIIIKPDAIQRGLCGEIIGRFERKGLKLIGGKFMQAGDAIAKQHYAEHEGKPFFGDLVEFITATPVLVLAVRGPQAVTVCRNLIGATDGCEAAPGTIRGDFGLSKATNLVHGSDSTESARREIELWFEKGELQEWSREHERWIHEQD
jgi:nucleoside-diphosphate kinase